MKIHKTGKRHSLNGTSAELHRLADRLAVTLFEMDAHDAKLAAIRAERGDTRGAGEHYVDFGLDEVDGLEDQSPADPDQLVKLVGSR